MRGVIPLFASSRAAVRPAGPAPMINGFLVDSISVLPATKLWNLPVRSNQIVDVVLGQIVEWGLQEDQLGVLTLQWQKSTEQWFGSGPHDHVDGSDFEGSVDVTSFALSALTRGAQLVVGVISSKNVDPEIATGHSRFQVLDGSDVFVRQCISIPMQSHTAHGAIKVIGNQRGDE